jgi:hypothetical protein
MKIALSCEENKDENILKVFDVISCYTSCITSAVPHIHFNLSGNGRRTHFASVILKSTLINTI